MSGARSTWCSYGELYTTEVMWLGWLREARRGKANGQKPPSPVLHTNGASLRQPPFIQTDRRSQCLLAKNFVRVHFGHELDPYAEDLERFASWLLTVGYPKSKSWVGWILVRFQIVTGTSIRGCADVTASQLSGGACYAMSRKCRSKRDLDSPHDRLRESLTFSRVM